MASSTDYLCAKGPVKGSILRGMLVLTNSFRTMLAVATAGFIASAITVFTAATDQVEASASIDAAKSDRREVRPIGPYCSQRAWPYYETHCLRDLRPLSAQTKPMRIVTTDRR